MGFSAFLLASTAVLASAQVGVGGPNELRVEGEVVVRDATIHVECERDWQNLDCSVRQQFELQAGATGARLLTPVRSLESFELRVDGEETRGDVLLAAGESMTFDVRYRMATPRGTRYLEPVLDLRHSLLGEGQRFYRVGVGRSLPVLVGETVHVEGTVRVEADVSGLDVDVDRERVTRWPYHTPTLPRIHVGYHRGAESVANGGPAVALGGRIDLDRSGGRFWFAVGYELGLFEHFIASLWFETDIESISEALLIEVATPGLFILPSVSVGVGVVATQLGPRGAEGALRIRMTLSSFVLGFVSDFDYFPSTGTWTAGLAGRVGI